MPCKQCRAETSCSLTLTRDSPRRRLGLVRPSTPTYARLEPFVRSGQTVVVYHHLGRTATHPVQMRDWAERLARELRLDAEPHILWYRRGTARAYFVIPADSHAKTIDERLERFMRSPWFMPSPGFKIPHFTPLPPAESGPSQASKATESRTQATQRRSQVSAEPQTVAGARDLVAAVALPMTVSSKRTEGATASRDPLGDLSKRALEDLPLPVAYRWRLVQAARGSSNALQAVLNAHEVLLAYVSIMALTAARVAGTAIGQVNDIRDRLMKRRGGVTLGDWRAVLQQAANSKSFKRLPPDHPFVEVRDFFGDDAAVAASRRLNDRRNDISHGRDFGPGELESALSSARSDLATLLGAADFVAQYPLIEILETRWDAIERRNEVTYRHLKGDSPIVPPSTRTVESNTVETGSLYLVDSQDKLHLLRPLLIGSECPACGNWSTFIPDRVRPDGVVEYKSLERGHGLRTPPSARQALASVGFLEPETI